jgi:hypothetical protein
MTMDTSALPVPDTQLATLLPYGFARSRGALLARRSGSPGEVKRRLEAESAPSEGA